MNRTLQDEVAAASAFDATFDELLSQSSMGGPAFADLGAVLTPAMRQRYEIEFGSGNTLAAGSPEPPLVLEGTTSGAHADGSSQANSIDSFLGALLIAAGDNRSRMIVIMDSSGGNVSLINTQSGGVFAYCAFSPRLAPTEPDHHGSFPFRRKLRLPVEQLVERLNSENVFSYLEEHSARTVVTWALNMERFDRPPQTTFLMACSSAVERSGLIPDWLDDTQARGAALDCLRQVRFAQYLDQGQSRLTCHGAAFGTSNGDSGRSGPRIVTSADDRHRGSREWTRIRGHFPGGTFLARFVFALAMMLSPKKGLLSHRAEGSSRRLSSTRTRRRRNIWYPSLRSHDRDRVLVRRLMSLYPESVRLQQAIRMTRAVRTLDTSRRHRARFVADSVFQALGYRYRLRWQAKTIDRDHPTVALMKYESALLAAIVQGLVGEVRDQASQPWAHKYANSSRWTSWIFNAGPLRWAGQGDSASELAALLRSDPCALARSGTAEPRLLGDIDVGTRTWVRWLSRIFPSDLRLRRSIEFAAELTVTETFCQRAWLALKTVGMALRYRNRWLGQVIFAAVATLIRSARTQGVDRFSVRSRGFGSPARVQRLCVTVVAIGILLIGSATWVAQGSASETTAKQHSSNSTSTARTTSEANRMPLSAPPFVEGSKPPSWVASSMGSAQHGLVIRESAYFYPNTARWLPTTLPDLRSFVFQVSNYNPAHANVVVVGHSARVGSPAGAMELSTARAEAVAAILKDLGVTTTTVVGRGYADPLPYPSNPQSPMNRVVMVNVTFDRK